MSIKRKPSKFEQKLIITPIRKYIEHKFNIEVERNDTLNLKPPYIILSNHVNNWDPIFLNCYVNEPICFVAAAPLFRNPLLRMVLNYAGAIPKTKFKNDTSTIRNMILAKKHNRAIGIFPEGNRCWDGVTEPIVYSTAKLVKLLDIPVVIATIRGGYLSHPRWADSDRKGKISVSFVKHWETGDMKNLSTDEIHEKLTEALKYNELDWQKKQQILFKGERIANYLERYLFVCPHCQKPGHMHSEDDLFYCKSCQYTVRYTAQGFFQQVQHPIVFEAIQDWGIWQKKYVAEQITQPIWSDVMKDEIKLFVSENEQPFTLLHEGKIEWENDHIIFTSKNETNKIRFALKELDGLNVHFHHKLDFFHYNKLYRTEFFQPRSSANKWMMFIQTMIKAKGAQQ